MIIGLSGYAQSGKNTLANFLQEKYEFNQLAFSDPIREALIALDPEIRIQGLTAPVLLSTAVSSFGWEYLKANAPEVRPLLQRFGTEVGRKMFGQNFWVDMAMKSADKHTDVVFSDVRFVNEAEAIQARGGVIWRVERPGTLAVNLHPSESSMDNFNFDKVLLNDGTVESLEEKITQTLDSLRFSDWV